MKNAERAAEKTTKIKLGMGVCDNILVALANIYAMETLNNKDNDFATVATACLLHALHLLTGTPVKELGQDASRHAENVKKDAGEPHGRKRKNRRSAASSEQ